VQFPNQRFIEHRLAPRAGGQVSGPAVDPQCPTAEGKSLLYQAGELPDQHCPVYRR
jgi:hypothetical protein